MSEFSDLKRTLDSSVRKINEELQDHLQSINDNTNEIQANYEHSFRLDERLKKIQKRLDRIEAIMSKFAGISVEAEETPGIELNDYEKKIFLILYTASERKPVSYDQIAQWLGGDELLIRGHVTNMLEKGLPVHKRHSDGCVYLSLDREFREKQAKHNVLRISQKTVREFLA